MSETGPATVGAGGTATFTVVVANLGKSTSNSFTVNETLTATPPTATSPTNTYTAVVTCVPSTGATCPTQLGTVISVPSLDPGRFLTLTYQVAVPSASRDAIVNVVSLTDTNDSNLNNNTASLTTTAVDGRNGTYNVYAANGLQFVLVIDFDHSTYTMSDPTGKLPSVQKSFTSANNTDSNGSPEPAANTDYIVTNTPPTPTQRLRVAQDLVIGNHDFGAGAIPYIAARSFLTNTADASFNLATRNVATDGTGTATTNAGTASISGNSLYVCVTQSGVTLVGSCPNGATPYALALTGNIFTGTNASGNPFTFQLARSGQSIILLSTIIAPDGSQQLTVGLQSAPGLSWGTLYGPTESGDWVTLKLDQNNTEYIALGPSTSDLAVVQKISNSGPNGMVLGPLQSGPLGNVYIMQASPLAIVVGQFGSVNNTTSGLFQVAVP